MKIVLPVIAALTLMANDALRAQSEVAKLHDTSDGLVLTPPMGWYPWNQFGEEQNEVLIKETADALVKSGLRDAGYTFVGPCEGKCYERDANGRLTTVLDRYPGGLRELGDYIHGLGLKYSLYTDAGTRTCTNGMPGTKGHEFEDMVSFADWRCDYLKVDWCNAEGMKEADAYALLHRAQLASGRPVVHSICCWGHAYPWTGWGLSSAHLWRTTGDICGPGKINWKKANWIAFLQQRLYQAAGPGHWNDPDMLMVGMPDMTDAMNRTQFSLWCIMASPLIAGNDLRTMTPETRAVLTNLEAIAVNQDPLGIQGHILHDSNNLSLWGGKKLYDGSQAVVLYNQQSTPADVHLTWEELGLEKSASCYVRDLWKHETTGPHAKGIDVSVPANDVVMLRISPKKEFPLPPIISADTYRLSFRAVRSANAPRKTLFGKVTVKTAGTDALPEWKLHGKLPEWLAVKVVNNGKSQAFTTAVNPAVLKPGTYHALVRADNTEPVSGQPMSAFYYDVDLEVVDDAGGNNTESPAPGAAAATPHP